MFKKLLSRVSFFVLFTVCFSIVFSSCSTEEPTVNTEEQAENTILTNIFSETEYNVPANFKMLNGIIPYYDEEKGTVTVFSLTTQEILSEDSVITEKKQGWLYTFALSGEILETEEIPLPEDVVSVFGGGITENSLFYIDSTIYGKVIYRTNRITGETISTERSTDFFGKEDFGYAL